MESYNETILDRKKVFFMYIDALSDSLSRLCDEYGLNYEDASRRCRCSACYFSRIIRRKSVPSIAILENICNGFGKTPDCLLQVSPDTEEKSYRTPMRIEALRAYRTGDGLFAFSVCPAVTARWSGNIRRFATVADNGCCGRAFGKPLFL